MEKEDIKYECECGGKYTKTNWSKHKVMKIHTRWENIKAQIEHLNLQIQWQYQQIVQYQQMINYYYSQNLTPKLDPKLDP